MNLEQCTKRGKIGLHEIYLDKDRKPVLVCRDSRNVSVRVNERALKLFAGMKGAQVVLVNCMDYQWEMTPEEIREQPDFVPDGPYGAFWGVEPPIGEVF